MPVIHVWMLNGRTPEQKRRLVAGFTDLMVEVAGAERDRVNVIIDEVEAENWGRGGALLRKVATEERK